MTIGMVAFGRKAGLGIFKGLEAVEKVSEGSIFGFAVLQVITKKGKLVHMRLKETCYEKSIKY